MSWQLEWSMGQDMGWDLLLDFLSELQCVSMRLPLVLYTQILLDISRAIVVAVLSHCLERTSSLVPDLFSSQDHRNRLAVGDPSTQ